MVPVAVSVEAESFRRKDVGHLCGVCVTETVVDADVAVEYDGFDE